MNRGVTVCILAIAMLQMSVVTFGASVSGMVEAFPDSSVASIQTSINFNCVTSMLFSLAAGWLVRRVSKKAVIVTGIACLLVTAAGGYFFHGSIVLLYIWFGVMGMGLGLFNPTASSLLVDHYEEKPRNRLTGMQASFINIGGVILTFIGGLLAVAAWYRSFLTLLLCIPALIICIKLLPAKNKVSLTPANEKLRLPRKVYYYPVITMLFMFLYNIFMVNISVFIHDNALGDASFTGIVNALFMVASIGSGMAFGNLSSRIGEYTLALGFIMLGVGYLIVCYSGSALGLIAGTLISGFSLSLNMAQCVYSVSKRTPPILAATAMSLTITVLPNIGMFASPTVFAALSSTFFGEGSGGKFLLGAIASIAIALVTGVVTKRTKNEII